VVVALLAGAGYLTYEAIEHDNYHRWHLVAPADTRLAELHRERTESAISFHEARDQAEREYERAKELIAFYGIPREGATAGLIRNDPEIQGPRLFQAKCASCHSYLDEKGRGIRGPALQRQEDGTYEPTGAPNLYGFATRDWFQRFLDPGRISGPDVFGATKHAEGTMANDFVKAELVDLNVDQKLQRDWIALALSAEAALLGERGFDLQGEARGQLERGRAGLQTAIKDQACTDCHKFHDAGDLGAAPDLTGYGSYEWLRGFIANPAHERFYGETGNDRMPAFAADSTYPQNNLLSDHELDMLVRWLRGDDRDLIRKHTPLRKTAPASSPEPTPAEPVPATSQEPVADESVKASSPAPATTQEPVAAESVKASSPAPAETPKGDEK
jgi:mono/diheme cytochrome c family protein